MSDTVQAALIGAMVASVVALLTVLTERWKSRTTASSETAAWRRETMFSVAHRYVDLGFAISGTSGNARRVRVQGQNSLPSKSTSLSVSGCTRNSPAN